MAYKHIDDEIEPYFDLIMDCIKLRGKDVKETIEKITEDTKTMETCLEDNFLGFKLHSKKVRDEYEKAVKEEIEKTEEVWEKCEELIYKSKPTIEQATSSTAEFLANVMQINKGISEISIWKIEKVIELIEKFSRLTEKEKKMFKVLLESEDNNS